MPLNMGIRVGLRRAAVAPNVAPNVARRQLLASQATLLQPRFAAAALLSSSNGSRSSHATQNWSSSMSHIKFFSSSADANNSSSSDRQDEINEPVLVYEGPMARAVRLMKGVSVTSCILTSVGMPTLCFVSEQSASMVGKWAMCGTIMLFGLGTTSLFHVLFKPYVMRMWVAPASSSSTPRPSSSNDVNDVNDDMDVTVETVTLFAQLTKHSFKLSDTSPVSSKSMHPMLSFQARGKSFFVHPEVFDDRAFAERLIRKKIDAPPRKRDDDDDDDDE